MNTVPLCTDDDKRWDFDPRIHSLIVRASKDHAVIIVLENGQPVFRTSNLSRFWSHNARAVADIVGQL